jgi:hypothetical protein
LYLHLIHGWVYENRRAWPFFWRICSENDAHALFVTFQGIHRTTGNPLYELLKRQLLLSVIDRQEDDGGWHHGEWTREMESHFRLHCSGMHLLMDALSEAPDAAVAGSLEKAAVFIGEHADRIDAGSWFLHDSLEMSEVGMAMSPSAWVRCKSLGKSTSNMLVLNTHLDTAIALDRYRELTGDGRFKELVRSAQHASEAVLTNRPAEALYAAIFKLVNLSFLPSDEAKRLPLFKRALKRVGWKYLAPNLHYLKAVWPRLVMPGGYIDRALTLRGVADVYLSINLMDLLRFYRRFGDRYLWELIQASFNLDNDVHITKRWAEHTAKAYGLGFWTESLYQAATLVFDMDVRRRLAESVIELSDRGMGLPPSVFGSNCEAIPPGQQIAFANWDIERLRVVNLSREGCLEALLVNIGDTPIARPFSGDFLTNALRFVDSGGRPLSAEDRTIPPRDWILVSEWDPVLT